MAPDANAQALPSGGEGAVGGDDQVGLRLCPRHRVSRGEAELAVDGGVGLHQLQQHRHQRAVFRDPAHGLAFRPRSPEIGRAEAKPPPTAQIRQIEPVEGLQRGAHPLPEAQAPQQLARGMGEGVGPPAGQQTSG